MLSVPPVQVPLALANAPLSNSRGAGVCQASRHRWGSLRGMLHGWQSAFLPQRAACVLSTQSHATARRSDAVKNASRCDCQRMPLQSPTQAAAIANACRCDCQRKPLRLPTHAAAIANACRCVSPRGTLPLSGERAGESPKREAAGDAMVSCRRGVCLRLMPCACPMSSCSGGTPRCWRCSPVWISLRSWPRLGSCRSGTCAGSTCGPGSSCPAAGRRAVCCWL